jgi:hypothetical protein
MLSSTTVAIVPTGRITAEIVYDVSDLNKYVSNTAMGDIYHLLGSNRPTTSTSLCTGRRVETGVAGINIPLPS